MAPGEREGAGPDGDPMLRSLRNRSLADGETRGRAGDLEEVVRGILRSRGRCLAVTLRDESERRFEPPRRRSVGERPALVRAAGLKGGGRQGPWQGRRESVRSDATWGSFGMGTKGGRFCHLLSSGMNGHG